MAKRSGKFFTAFFKKNSKVGSVTPSSSFLAKKMLKNIDFSKDIVVVEHGPGTGVFTKKIVQKLSPNSKLFVFELNRDFVATLKREIHDDRVKIICDSSANLQKYLAEDNITEVDYIVSSLPLSIIPKEIRESIVEESYKSLKTDGIMTQFQYSQQCKGIFKHYFPSVKVEFTPLNFPPAFVYVCRK